MKQYFVCGDIGGTKTLLQVARTHNGQIQVLHRQQYDSQAFPDFADVLRDFLGKAAIAGAPPSAACLAVAGPVVAQRARLTNLPWQMDAAAIAAEFSIPAVKLINDFAAVALGVEALSASDLVTLQAGTPQAKESGLRVVLGAGTGMGVAWLAWQDGRAVPLPTEAGHMDFAPANELQVRLLEHLRDKYGHVSVERVLSGSGLTDMFNFLQASLGKASGLVPANLDGDSGAAVTELALNRRHPLALKALDLFIEIYGAYAGNLALAGLCRGGVYVAGGIAPKIIGKLQEGGFIKAFCDKGRFSSLMGEIPVHVVMNPEVGLLGAAREAQRMLEP